jgi:hypothetical protein
MPTAAPCPQACRTSQPGVADPNPLLMAIEANPPVPRAVDPNQPPDKPFYGLDRSIIWRYHLPQWEDLDAYLWSMIARASHGPDITFFNEVLATTGTVQNSVWVPPPNDSAQLYAFGKMLDVNYVVIGATATDLELIQYVCSHSLGQIITDPTKGWQFNAAWLSRATPIVSAYLGFESRDTQPLVVVGHSSGGAYAAAFAYTLNVLRPNTRIAVVTFGTPAWCLSTTRLTLSTILNVQPIEFAHPSDLVAYIPPSGSILNQYYVGSENVLPLNWTRVGSLLGLSPTVHFQYIPLPLNTPSVEGIARRLFDGTLNVAVHPTSVYTASASFWTNQNPGSGEEFTLIGNLNGIRAAMDADGIH